MAYAKVFAGTSILVIDADLPTRVLLDAVLRRLGATVLLAEDGAEGLAKLVPPPDLLVLELGLPKVSGYDILEHLRVHQPSMLARTLVFTAASKGDVDALLGSLAVLHKPWDTDAFIEALASRFDAPIPVLPPLSGWRERLRALPSGEKLDASARGRKGGEAVSRDRDHMAAIARKGAQARRKRQDS